MALFCAHSPALELFCVQLFLYLPLHLEDFRGGTWLSVCQTESDFMSDHDLPSSMEEGGWLIIAMSTFHSKHQDSNSSTVPAMLRLVLHIRVQGQSQFPHPPKPGLQHVASRTFPDYCNAQSNECTNVQELALKQLVKPRANHINGSWLPLASLFNHSMDS